MSETYAERETQGSRRDKENKGLRANTDSRENAGRSSEGTGTQCLELDREDSSAGNLLGDALGGILDQLIADAQKQLGKSRECVVWYQSEVKEYEEKLQDLKRLKDLHLKQLQQENQEGDSEEVPP